jgi:hypothetical protein
LPSSAASAIFTSCPSLSQQRKIFSTLPQRQWCACAVVGLVCGVTRNLWGQVAQLACGVGPAGFHIPIGGSRRVDDEVGLGAATQAGRGREVKTDREALHAFRQGILACNRTSPLGSGQQHHAPAQERFRPRRIPGESEYMIRSECSGCEEERRRTKNEEENALSKLQWHCLLRGKGVPVSVAARRTRPPRP